MQTKLSQIKIVCYCHYQGCDLQPRGQVWPGDSFCVTCTASLNLLYLQPSPCTPIWTWHLVQNSFKQRKLFLPSMKWEYSQQSMMSSWWIILWTSFIEACPAVNSPVVLWLVVVGLQSPVFWGCRKSARVPLEPGKAIWSDLWGNFHPNIIWYTSYQPMMVLLLNSLPAISASM